jgi:hypothetical protein
MSSIITDTTLNSTYLTSPSNWPITISAPCTVTIANSVSIPGSSSGYYFNIQSDNVTINGGGNTFTLTSVTDGLIRNGTSTQNGFSDVTIENLLVNGSSTTINSGGGWVCQSYFGNGGAINNNVENCSSQGNITTTYSGGIFGQ